MKEGRKLHMFLILLAGALFSAMLVMMRLGGGVNFEEFMSAGRVYDFEPAVFQEGSSSWIYDQEKGGYWLSKDKAAKTYRIDGKKQTWNFLYITVNRMSRESVEGILRYYDSDSQMVGEQSVTLAKGRNMIFLDGTVPMVKMKIILLDAQGEFIAVSGMQIRTTPCWFTVPHFVELYLPALAGSLVVLAVLEFVWRRLCAKGSREKRTFGITMLFDVLQDAVQIGGGFIGKKVGGKLYPHQKESVRKFLFSVLFVWMMVGNAAGWLNNADMYRYHVLVCVLLLLFISFVSWERPLQNWPWHGPLMKSWLGIWLGVLLCDFFIIRQLESVTGYAMLLAGSVFICFWQNMKRPDRMLRNMMEALEITFFLAIIYCMVFRMKHPAVDYSGVFKSPEELAMYAVLMAVVFLTELDWLISDKVAAADVRGMDIAQGAVFVSCVKDIAGGGIALFFVLRSGHALGIFIFMLCGVFYIPNMLVKIYGMAKKCRVMFLNIIVGLVFAYACIGVIFISTKYLPEIVGMDLEYENELLLTGLEGEEEELYLMQYPGSLDGVRTKECAKLPIIWRNYARRLNLFGHAGGLEVFRREIQPYNSYLDMAYRHGIFILLPYVAFQVMVIALGIKCAFRKGRRRNIYMLFLGIAYLCFSVGSNVEISWGHPLWLCYYLSVGYLGRMEIVKT